MKKVIGITGSTGFLVVVVMTGLRNIENGRWLVGAQQVLNIGFYA